MLETIRNDEKLLIILRNERPHKGMESSYVSDKKNIKT